MLLERSWEIYEIKCLWNILILQWCALLLQLANFLNDHIWSGLNSYENCSAIKLWKISRTLNSFNFWTSFTLRINVTKTHIFVVRWSVEQGSTVASIELKHFSLSSCVCVHMQATKDLQRIVDFKNVEIYSGLHYRKRFKAPTDFCFTLKVRFWGIFSRKKCRP